MIARAEWLEILMRVTPIAGALGFFAVLLASTGVSQTPDNQLNPRSVELLKQGEAAIAAGNFQAADDALEAALILDPRNRQAFIGLARVAQRQKLYGQAIRFTNRALALEPNDINALQVQGEAMVEMGAVARAQQNLARVRKLCGSQPCPQATRLSTAIAKGPAVAAKSEPAAPKKN